jgi:hypothetical protein
MCAAIQNALIDGLNKSIKINVQQILLFFFFFLIFGFHKQQKF